MTSATPDPDRAQLLADRSLGLGGSDISSLFNLGYGCQLRLWRQKRGEEPDFPRRETGPMELGRILEPYFADHYERITGRRVEVRGVAFHPIHPELLVHVDRMIYDARRRGPGVLEIKSVGKEVYYKTKREGLPEDYILQLQHGMLVTETAWGAFCVGSRDMGVSRPEDLLYWDMERDEAICAEILEAGPQFWATVENGPAPEMLPPDDSRCYRCEYRTSCQGAALIQVESGRGDQIPQDDSLWPLLAEYDERTALLDEAEGLVNETKESIRAALGNRPAVRVGKRPIYFRTQSSYRWSSEDLAEAYAMATGKVDYDGRFLPAGLGGVAKEFKRASESRPLRIY